MVNLKLYNTLNRTKEEFKPLNKKAVTFYYCGPTVYSHQHIGNLRGAMMADLIRRSIEYLNYKVTFVRNYTDVGHLTSDGDIGEDKMIKAAKKEQLEPLKIAEKYIKIYEADTTKINIKDPTYKPRATVYVPQMIAMVEKLIKKKYAYVTPLAIYYNVSKFSDYNKLNKQKITKNIAGLGAGDVQDSNKKHPADFSIWFFRAGEHKNALQYWSSPFHSPLVKNGYGFPGWHMECSAMAGDLLGKTIDIHMGGIEHINVHHTNEIAQSEAVNGVKYVNYWLHNGHLRVNNEKMSKSLGNVYLLKDITFKMSDDGASFSALDLRFFFLQAHYRSSQNFTWQALQAARNARQSLKMAIKRRFVAIKKGGIVTVVDTSWQKEADNPQSFANQFANALKDDINIPRALAVVFDLSQAVLDLKDKFALLKKFDQVLQIGLTNIIENYEKRFLKEIKKIEDLIKERHKYRENKEWDNADEIKQKLLKMKVIMEDTPQGTVWR